MNRKLIITYYQGKIATLLFHDNKAVELFLEEPLQKSLVGNIYIGKVKNVVKNIQTAFIEIEGGVPCYYREEEHIRPYYTKKGNSPRMCQGDELLVQVTKDAVKSKAPSVTSQISLSGQLLVLTAQKTMISLSNKIEGNRRDYLTSLLRPFKNQEYGWIIRTNAADAPDEEILSEAKKLSEEYQKLLEIAAHRTARSCLYRNPAAWLLHLKNTYRSEYEEIITDDPALYEEISAYIKELGRLDDKVTLYEDRLLPLSKLYGVEKSFGDALKERVWLSSGAYLVIQPTEALVAIDVNTGKCDRGKNAARTFARINREAAAEIARQIRLRNLSGMILIDFINMDSKEDRDALMDYLAECMKSDHIKTAVVDMTALGLVEVTRKRIHKPIYECY